LNEVVDARHKVGHDEGGCGDPSSKKIIPSSTLTLDRAFMPAMEEAVRDEAGGEENRNARQ
jgi:hypothetical protein